MTVSKRGSYGYLCRVPHGLIGQLIVEQSHEWRDSDVPVLKMFAIRVKQVTASHPMQIRV
jgi:hypothetical protein